MRLEDDLRRRVRELRAAGRSPKQIARALGVGPATIAPLVRAMARQDAATQQEPAVVGCWVSPGWSTALTIDKHEDWPDVAIPDGGPEGVACVVVARRHRPPRVSVCGYLLDVYCLGVKNALGPQIMNERDRVGAELLIHGGDLRHRWTVVVGHDRRSRRYDCCI
jgi:hypothetical protein